MKILYLTTWDFSNEESDGVCKKIHSHINSFEKDNNQVDFLYLKDNRIVYRENGKVHLLDKVGAIKKTPAYMKMYKHLKDKKYDWVYNRYGMMDTFYYRVLKRLNRNGARIIIEIPTYPYVGEVPKTFLYNMMIKWDDLYLKKMKSCVDAIATYSQDDMIFGIKTIKAVNGVDFSKISLKENCNLKDSIDLVGVANVSKWHGFDRVIYGLKNYYLSNDISKDVRFHIVGEGSVLDEYKKIVAENNLQEYVIFYGKRKGKELEAVYNQCDIAVSSLGLHRIGITTQASVLKSREYAAKGMPMISSILIDIFPAETYKYIKYFSEDDSPIDINTIVEWYGELQKEKKDIRELIRNYAIKKCDQSVVMEPIIQYMKEG